MRHRKKTVKLGRTSSHRESMLSSMVCSLIKERRIETTLAKAKAARSYAEKMVTLGKRGDLAARRRAISKLKQRDAVQILWDEIAPNFKERNGGYTRIYKLGKRRDSTEMALLEWVGMTFEVAESDDDFSIDTGADKATEAASEKVADKVEKVADAATDAAIDD